MNALFIARILLIVMCAVSIILMSRDFNRYGPYWNQKTRDYWYGRMAWCISGVIWGLESTIRHAPFRYTFVFLFVAALVTLKGNAQGGRWGDDTHA